MKSGDLTRIRGQNGPDDDYLAAAAWHSTVYGATKREKSPSTQLNLSLVEKKLDLRFQTSLYFKLKLLSRTMSLLHSWLRTLSNHVFKSQIKFYPIFLLAENRELNEMMVVALRKPFQSYQYSTGIYLTWYCQKMPKMPYLWLFMYYLVLLSHFKQQKI